MDLVNKCYNFYSSHHSLKNLTVRLTRCPAAGAESTDPGGGTKIVPDRTLWAETTKMNATPKAKEDERYILKCTPEDPLRLGAMSIPGKLSTEVHPLYANKAVKKQGHAVGGNSVVLGYSLVKV